MQLPLVQLIKASSQEFKVYEAIYATPFQDTLLIGLLESRANSSFAEPPAELHHLSPAMLASPIGRCGIYAFEVASNFGDKGLFKFGGFHGK
jgi:hypothetical protein